MRLISFTKRKILLLMVVFLMFILIITEFYISEKRINPDNIKDMVKMIENEYCPNPPVDLRGQVSLALDDYSFEDIVKKLEKQGIEHGGYWAPEDCIATDYVAILVPYRNRSEHLNAFLLNMHPIFAKQKIAYKIYLVEPVANVTFNRGLLFNIGFIESNKDGNDRWQCHAYHDVDLLSEDDRTLFTCPPSPTHLAHFVSKRNYSAHYPSYFGGASIMMKNEYIKVNGYSNIYFGWGAEDDDHHFRIQNKNLTVINPLKLPLGKYYTFKHDRVDENPYRNILRNSGNKERYETEGLNTVQYKLIETIKTPLFTKFLVYYDKDEYMKSIKINLTAALEEERRFWKEQGRIRYEQKYKEFMEKNKTIQI